MIWLALSATPSPVPVPAAEGGPGTDPAVIAATIAALVAFANIVVTFVVNYRAQRHARTRAEQEASWVRVTWALERAAEPTTAKMGLTAIDGLLEAPDMLTPADMRLAMACADAIWDDVEER